MDAQAFFNAPNPLAYDQHPKNIQATGRDDSSHDNSRASRSGQQKKEAPASSRGKRLSMEGSPLREEKRAMQTKAKPRKVFFKTCSSPSAALFVYDKAWTKNRKVCAWSN
ncbi:MAG: hypothetical protein EBW71_02250 [Betaproteobacteria bacterium]|nr:hypothetical protein [Betaproteobacteria bacterium]